MFVGGGMWWNVVYEACDMECTQCVVCVCVCVRVSMFAYFCYMLSLVLCLLTF